MTRGWRRYQPEPAGATRSVELTIGGMTCASCAARIEKKLNKLDGVTATVNFATENARVSFPGHGQPGRPDRGRRADRLHGRRCPGQRRMPPRRAAGSRRASPRGTRARRQRCGAGCWCRWRSRSRWWCWRWCRRCSSANWQWLSLALATPVAVWGAWPFHRAALANARHGAATMDTLISAGVSAAYLWSLYALFFGTAGSQGCAHELHACWLGTRGRGVADIYLEVAAGVTALVLLGRYLEARAKRRAGAALRALLALGAKDVAVLRDGARGADPGGPAGRRATGSWSGRARRSRPTASWTPAARRSTPRCSPASRCPVEVGRRRPRSPAACVNTSGRLVVRATRVGADTAARPDQPGW